MKLMHLSKTDLILWGGSVLLVLSAFLYFDRSQPLSLAASLVGVTSLIFLAKGHPVAHVLGIVFSLLYGYISLTFRYYGEMITYLGMTMPMAAFSLVSWLRHPFQAGAPEVQVGHISRRECLLMLPLTAAVTGGFYCILAAFHTANLLPSTLSIATSFAAMYLSFRRSPYYAAAYAANDLVLLVLWGLATLEQPRYASVFACFLAFLANDIYGFLSWRRMEKRQAQCLGEG